MTVFPPGPAVGRRAVRASLAGRLDRLLRLTLVLLAAIVLTGVGRLCVTDLWFQPKLGRVLAMQQNAADQADAMRREEIALRGYLLSGDARLLTDYRSAGTAYASARMRLAADAGPDLAPLMRAEGAAATAWRAGYAGPALAQVAGGSAAARSGAGTAARDGSSGGAARPTTDDRYFGAYRRAAADLSRSLAAQLRGLNRTYGLLVGVLTGLELLAGIALAGSLVARRRRMRAEVTRPVEEILAVLGRIADGDLDARPVLPAATELTAIGTGIAELAEAVSSEHDLRVDRERRAVAAATTSRQLLEVARGFVTSLDQAEVLAAVGHALGELSAGAQVTLWMAEPGGPTGTADAAADAAPDAAPLTAAFSTVPEAPVGARATVDGLPAGAAAAGRLVSAEATRCHVAVPLQAAGRCLGVAELRSPAPVDNNTLDAVQTLSLHAASALAAAQLHEQVAELSRRDPLTGLLNRRRHDEDLAAALSTANRRPVAYLLVDVDHFKRYNDRHGHLAGDRLLRELGRLLRESMRGDASVYRYGGEEFAVLLPGTPERGALALAERLRARIAQEFAADAVTASFGVAVSGGTPATDGLAGLMERLVTAADAGLYAAKRAGRNRVGRATVTRATAPTRPPANPPTRPPANPPTRPPANPPTRPPANPPTRPPANPPANPPAHTRSAAAG